MDDFKAQYLAYIQSQEWELKRQETFKLFGRACKKCGAARHLQIHHKTYARFKHERVDTDLIPLCRPCHKGLHQFCKRYGLNVERGSQQFLAPAPVDRSIGRRLASVLRIPQLMRKHDLCERDVRALIEVGAL